MVKSTSDTWSMHHLIRTVHIVKSASGTGNVVILSYTVDIVNRLLILDPAFLLAFHWTSGNILIGDQVSSYLIAEVGFLLPVLWTPWNLLLIRGPRFPLTFTRCNVKSDSNTVNIFPLTCNVDILKAFSDSGTRFPFTSSVDIVKSSDLGQGFLLSALWTSWHLLLVLERLLFLPILWTS